MLQSNRSDRGIFDVIDGVPTMSTAIAYTPEDLLAFGEDVIPGFRCPVREILPKRPPADNGPQPPTEPNGVR